MRPELVAVVTGTGTEVGKTWLATWLADALRHGGHSVVARKPAQSYAPGADTDADLLARASGEEVYRVCPEHRWYPIPMAPPMAAAALGRTPPRLADLAEEIRSGWPDSGTDVGLIEGAGGVASPQAVDGDMADLATAIGADRVLLVARAGLGTINDVRLAARALSRFPVVVFLNRFDPADDVHRRNRDWLSEVDRLIVRTEPADVSAWLLEAG